MTSRPRFARWTAGLLLVLLATTLAAPAADAGHSKKKWKYRKAYDSPACETIVVRHRYAPPRRVVVRHYDDPAPVLAGFLGGLFLGATLNHAASDGYFYYDPYCHERFASLDLYHRHFSKHYHPRIVRVVEVRTGRWVDSYHYDRGAWRHWEDDWDE